MTEDEKPTGRLSFMVPQEIIDEIDDWRRRQPRIPSMAEASRVMLQIGLANCEQTKSRMTADAAD